jgi:hypothetical protein
LNAQFRKFRLYKAEPKTLDQAILEFHEFESELNTDVKQSFYGQGPFQLRKEYKNLQKPLIEMPPHHVQGRRKVLKDMKEILNQHGDSKIEESPAKLISPHKTMIAIQRTARYINEKHQIEKVQYANQPIHYRVREPGGKEHSLSLSRNSCSCGSRILCAHMLSARVFAGLQDGYDIPEVSKPKKAKPLTKEMTGKRPVHGRKKPIKDDLVHHGITGNKSNVMKLPSTIPHSSQSTWVLDDVPRSGTDSLSYVPAITRSLSKTSINAEEVVVIGDKMYLPVSSNISEMETDFTLADEYNGEFGWTQVDFEDLNRSHSEKDNDFIMDVVSETHELPTLDLGTSQVQSQPVMMDHNYSAQPQTFFGDLKGDVIISKKQMHPKSTIENKSLSNRIVSKVLPANTLQIEEKDYRLQVGEYSLLKTESNNVVGIKCTENGTAIIIAENKKDVTLNVQALAGITVSSSALKSATNTNYVMVGELISAEKSINSMCQELDPKANVKKSKFTIGCYCGKPLCAGELTQCGTCKKTFHSVCANTTDKTFTCEVCRLPSKGAPWGSGNYSHSCPVDNHLSMMTILAKEDPQFLQLFDEKNRNQRIWKETLQLACNENWSAAHTKWGDLVAAKDFKVKTDKSLHGSPRSRVTTLLNSATEFVSTSTCETENCRRKPFATKNSDFALQKNVPLDDSIQNLVKDCDYLQCSRCTNSSGSQSYRQIAPLQVKNKERPPAYIEFENQIAQHSVEDFFKATESINIDGFDYKKRMITIKDHKRDHFYSLMNVNDKWILYDGLERNKSTKFRLASPIDWSDEGQEVNSVVYFHQKNKK